jgi:Flp pilus assembly protein TadD
MAGAEKAYESALRIDPAAPVAANNLAYIYALRGSNLDIALQLAQAAQQKLPDDPTVSDTLGWVYYKKNLPELAIPVLKTTVDKDPANYLYHYHLGLAYAKSGDKVNARHSLEKTLTLKPDSAEAADARKVLDSVRG